MIYDYRRVYINSLLIEMAEEKQAKRVITLEDVKFNEANKAMAALSCIPIVGLIMFFVEKEDLFVRYHGIQFALLSLVTLVAWIPCVGQLLALALLVAFVMGVIKTLKGERFDLPVVSDLAIKLMNSVQ